MRMLNKIEDWKTRKRQAELKVIEEAKDYTEGFDEDEVGSRYYLVNLDSALEDLKFIENEGYTYGYKD